MSCLLSIHCNLTSSYLHFADLANMSTKLLLFLFFLFCSWKSLCLRFLFPEAIPPSLSTLALPTWARRLGMVKKASKVMIKGKYLPILENMCHCIYTANGNNSSTYNLIILYICVSTVSPRIAYIFVQKIHHAIWNCTVWIYTMMFVKSRAILKNCAILLTRSNILGPKS